MCQVKPQGLLFLSLTPICISSEEFSTLFLFQMLFLFHWQWVTRAINIFFQIKFLLFIRHLLLATLTMKNFLHFPFSQWKCGRHN
jgi:hypothetical protein